MTEIHDFIKGSPFNYSGMDYQMEARVKDNSVPNAQADVVYHEYTHNIVYTVYGNNFIGSSGGAMGSAMDEGIADYYAATLNQNSAIDWVGRDVSNTLTWPNNYNAANPHFSGQILSGAMWDLESTISTNTGRKLNFKAMQITPQPDTYVEFVDNVILADDNNGKLCDGTPNYNDIIQAFQTNHGIVPTLNVGPPLAVNITGPSNLGL